MEPKIISKAPLRVRTGPPLLSVHGASIRRARYGAA